MFLFYFSLGDRRKTGKKWKLLKRRFLNWVLLKGLIIENQAIPELSGSDRAEAAAHPALPAPAQICSNVALPAASATPPSPQSRPRHCLPTLVPPWALRETAEGVLGCRAPHQNKVLPSKELKTAPTLGTGSLKRTKTYHRIEERGTSHGFIWRPLAYVVENA